jgi:hypothetical protein
MKKIRNYINALLHPLFFYIKIKTNGYLSSEVYYTIYKYGKQAPEGHAIDIGPAQGGTTISLAHGYRIARKNQKWKVFSIEKGLTSGALATKNVNINAQILTSNIRHFWLDNRVEIIMKYSHEAFMDKGIPCPLSTLSIDADGALDRDFQLFYNTLLPDSKIMLDDYGNIIDRQAQSRLQMSTEEIDTYLRAQGLQSFKKLNPLGKRFTTFKFVNYLIKHGFIKKDTIVGRTFFGIKPKTAPIFTAQHYNDMQCIREEIEKQFWQLHSVTQ